MLVQVNKQNETVNDFRERLSQESELVAILRDELNACNTQYNFDNRAQDRHEHVYVEPGVERGSPSGQERLAIENSTTTTQARDVRTPNAHAPSETTSGWNVVGCGVSSPAIVLGDWTVDPDDVEGLTAIMRSYKFGECPAEIKTALIDAMRMRKATKDREKKSGEDQHPSKP